VVFSRGALEFLSRDEPAMHATLVAALESWPLQRIAHKGERVDIDGNGFSAIARIVLLQILQRQCEALGVRIEFERALESPAPLAGFDLLVGADGVNSMVRRALHDSFQRRAEWLTNKFVWYGTARPFECLTLTFRTSGDGAFVAHHYRYAPAISTFIVECDAATQSSYWYERMSDQMRLEPWETAYDYMRRSGRMTDERLREEAPEFMRLVDEKRSSDPRRGPEPTADPVPRDAPGAAEIGFALAERYNASSILFDNLAAGQRRQDAARLRQPPGALRGICDAASRVCNGIRRMGLARAAGASSSSSTTRPSTRRRSSARSARGSFPCSSTRSLRPS
jgi:hypothetical protein